MDRKQALEALLVRVKAGEWPDDYGAAPLLSHLSDCLALAAFEGSLDAAKALHDAVLPGWPVRVMDHSQDYLGGHGWHACVNWPHMNAPEGRSAYLADSYSYTAWANNPARAWLIATLKALIAMEGVK